MDNSQLTIEFVPWAFTQVLKAKCEQEHPLHNFRAPELSAVLVPRVDPEQAEKPEVKLLLHINTWNGCKHVESTR